MGGGASLASGHSVQAALLKLTPTISIRSRCNSTSLHNHVIEECIEEFLIESTVVKRKFPCFENYLAEKCTMSELEQINKLRLHLNTPPHYIEFDHIFFQTLNESCTGMPFVMKPFCYKKQFVVELMRLVTCSSKAGFGEKVFEFAHRHQSESIAVEDFGLLGQVFLESIYALRSEEEGRLWTKAYCRFLRALLSQGCKLGFPVEEETTVSLR